MPAGKARLSPDQRHHHRSVATRTVVLAAVESPFAGRFEAGAARMVVYRKQPREGIVGYTHMTLLDAKVPKPPSKFRKLFPFLISILLVLAAFLYIEFRNYPEERAVARFLTTLQQGNYREAYQRWQPSPSYTFEDFLRGWGEMGDYGKIRQFEILGSKAKGSNTVIVTVRINNLNPPLDLLVDRKTKGLAYSVF